MRFDAALMWFRRDLRMADNAALYHALKSSRRVFCVFVFDRTILDALPSRTDRRVEFIHASLIELDAALRHHGGALIVQHGNATQDIPALAQALKVDAVFTNHDYEPAATARDAAVAQQLKTCGIDLIDFDLPANNGGWQWAASTGCDAQPWFRIFNPVTQSQKFDADGKFIRRYVPEVAGLSGKAIHAPWLVKADELKRAKALLGENYPLPIVDHTVARTRTLARFAAVTGANRAA